MRRILCESIVLRIAAGVLGTSAGALAGIACALGLVGAPRVTNLQAQGVEPKPVEQRVTADQLIARVIDARDTSGFRVRAKLTRISAAGAPVVRQLVIKSRTERGVTTMLYQVAWPEALAGEALEVELGHPSRGFIYQHGAVTQLEAGQAAVRVFDSDLHVEDLTQAFWDWTSRRLGAAGTVANRPCRTVDLRPPAAVGTEYSLIKACISVELSLPLQIEYYGGDGQLMKRAVVGGTVKRDKRWLARTITITAGSSKTVLEGTRYENHLYLPASDFTPEALKRSLLRQPRS